MRDDSRGRSAAKLTAGDLAVPKLPYSKEAEMAVLGSIMLNNNVMEEAVALGEEDFFLDAHRKIFKTMCKMFDNGSAIDIVTLSDALGDSLDKFGGIAYLGSLTSGLPKPKNITEYTAIIRRKALLRGVVKISDTAQNLALEQAENEEAIAEQLMQKTTELLSRYADFTKAKSPKSSKIVSIQAQEKKENRPRLRTGISSLDDMTGGFLPGELVTLSASATGSGKTLFAQQIMANACEFGMHGIYFSGEMPAEQLMNRAMATETGVPHWKMRQQEFLTKEEYKALFENAMKGCDVCRIVDGELSVRSIRTACQKMNASGSLSWAIVDYDELVDAPGKNEFEQQRNVVREAKRLAIKFDIPVVMISGIRKMPDKQAASSRSMLDNIYGSGAKSKHSSFVIFIDRKYVRQMKGDETEANIFILKSRDGRIGKVPAKFNIHTLRFEGA